ncbi:DUF924 family protein [Kordiimonas pumila]|uniref:DUF924 family protein n=1 Tax=Kordiimonas pumila TaxID=2161677 RepID=A0ABV7D9I6_9PROT|nr:DUF924 family protein [Kordiimonas pumila]
MRYEDVLYFWFQEAGVEAWWKKSKTFDDHVRRRFLSVYEKAAKGELWQWRESPRGRLAEIIILDQFPRNMFRDTPKSFATDSIALVLAQEAVHVKADTSLTPAEKQFLYMPYMHSESLSTHDVAVKLYSAPELVSNLDFEHRHRDIIARFGRYPHRNAILGRVSTVEEIAFLKEPGSSF